MKQPSPCRVVRKRAKGWRSLPGALYVGRPSIWGNPFRHKDSLRAKILFKHLLLGDPTHLLPELHKRHWKMMVNLISLRGENLMCFCSLERPCHGDVLLEAANSEEFPVARTGVNFAALLDRFKAGESMTDLAIRFGTQEAHVEEIVRWWMTGGDQAVPKQEVWP